MFGIKPVSSFKRNIPVLIVSTTHVGKSTLLTAISERDIPMPDHIDVFHLIEEICASDKTPLQCVMEVDEERYAVLVWSIYLCNYDIYYSVYLCICVNKGVLIGYFVIIFWLWLSFIVRAVTRRALEMSVVVKHIPCSFVWLAV